MANFTPQEIEEMLQEFFDTVGKRQYVGARYVPIFGRKGEDTIEWDNLAPYEPLTVVMHQGISYVSKQYVPKDVEITDTNYWAETYRFNAQVEQYRQEVLQFQSQIDQIREDMESDYVPFPDSNTYPKYGILGQVLTTLTGGETKWEDPVTVDAEIAEPLIEAWLDEHPEATTTVQDGSISIAKLAQATINSFVALSKSVTVTLQDTDNLDNLTTGNYRILNAATATALNAPEAGGGRLFHFDLQAEQRFLQLYMCGTNLYFRNYNGTTWSSWKHVLYDSDLVNLVKNLFMGLTSGTDTAITTSGADLNDYTTAGNYHCASATTAGTLLHCPITFAFKLYVVETTQTNRIVQIIVGNASLVSVYLRYYDGTTWYGWEKFLVPSDTITPRNLIATTSTQLDDFNNAPVNSIIATNRPDIPNGPNGDGVLINVDSSAGRLRGTLITYSPQNKNYTYICQIYIGYYSSITNASPIICYRFAISSGGIFSWSPWAKFSQDRFLGATNTVIRASTASLWFTDLDDVPPNTIYQIDKDCVSGVLAHHPAPGYSAVLNTYAFSVSTRHGMVQELWSLQSGRCVKYFRYGWLNDVDDYRWTPWEQVTTTQVV